MAKISKIVYAILIMVGPLCGAELNTKSGPVALSSSLGDAAMRKLGMDTSDIRGTNGGRLACAAAVQIVHKAAFGCPIGDGTMSTSELWKELSHDPNWVRVSSPSHGDIVISPTGRSRGHVGIYLKNGRIASNNSRSATFKAEFKSVEQWKDYFGGRKGLPTYFLRKIG